MKIEIYENGLDKLKITKTKVNELEKKLKELQPLLAEKTKEAEEKLVYLGTDQKIADEVSSSCKKEEIECTTVKERIKAMQIECQSDLDAAMPEYNKTLKELELLDKKDIDELKS